MTSVKNPLFERTLESIAKKECHRLELHSCLDWISPRQAQHLAEVLQEGSSCLEHVDLSDMGLGRDETLAILLQALSTENLQLLNVSYNPLRLPGIRALQPMARNVHTLVLHHARLDHQAVETLLTTTKDSSRLKQLLVTQNHIAGTQGGRALRRFWSQHPQLQRLELSDNPLGNAGLIELLQQEQPQSSSLQRLQLRHTRLTTTCCPALAHALTQSSLRCIQELDLSHNSLGDEGVVQLAKALPNHLTLHHLSLDSNLVGPRGGTALATAIPQCRKLQSLHLNANALGQEGAEALGQCLQVTTTNNNNKCSLKRLQLRRNGITDVTPLLQAVQTNWDLESLEATGNPAPRLADLRFWTRRNAYGARRLFFAAQQNPLLWPHLLASFKGQPDLLCHVLQQNSSIFQVLSRSQQV